MPDEFISQLEVRREACYREAERILTGARDAGRSVLSEIEQKRFDTARSEMLSIDARLEEQRADERRAILPPHLQHLTGKSTAMTTVREPDLYRPGGPHSFGLDLIRASTPGMDLNGEARTRLSRHTEEMVERRYAAGMEYRDLSRVDGSGGYAVPPAWLMDQYIELARPGRAFANLVQRQPLPGGTDSINIPKLLTGTTVAVQQSDNQDLTAAGADTDLTDTFINAPVRTISGQQGVAIQLIDQSPIAFDDVVFRDLVAAHAAATDQQVISGTGANGQVLGIQLTPGITSIAASAVDIQGVYSAIANAVQTIHTTRFLPPEVIVMHPRRWGWFLALLDASQRPLFLGTANAPMNVAGVLTDVASQQIVGSMHGLPVVTDPNIPVTQGTGNNEDPVFVVRASDLVLWEGGIRARVLPETKATTLTVLLQIYSYLAFSAARYPQSVVEITGLTAPTF
jgi:HK97 family phage major capsid protein